MDIISGSWEDLTLDEVHRREHFQECLPDVSWFLED